MLNPAGSLRAGTAIVAIATAGIIVGMPAQAAAETAQVMFSYQGRVKVQGQPFNGTGQFKFAITNTSGTTSLWSNDGTSVNGGQPSTELSIPVTDGVFNVLMGDPQASMQPINPTIFQSQTPLNLRVWFSDGINGFQQLNPDQKLINLTLTTIETGEQDFTIYVNSTTGNDANNGLSAETAKKTIQAAVDTLPDRIKCNVTIDVADGIYPEAVRVSGMSVIPGKKLTFIGDETWTASSPGSPAVQVTGQDSTDAGAPKVRPSGFHIVQCSGIVLKGFELEGYSNPALYTEATILDVDGCRFSNSLHGVFGVAGSDINFNSSQADHNVEDGFYVGRQTSAQATDCKANNNGGSGFRANAFTLIRFVGASQTTSNHVGALVQHHSTFVFTGSLSLTNNSLYGLMVSMMSYTENDQINTMTGNGNSNQPYVHEGSNRFNF